jgi:hypothetical protein
MLCSILGPSDQSGEPRLSTERIESRIDPEPPGREVERDPEQRLELVQGQRRLTGQQIDPDQLELHVRAQEGIAVDREQLDPAPPLANRLRLPSQVGQRQPEQHVALPVVGGGVALRLQRRSG